MERATDGAAAGFRIVTARPPLPADPEAARNALSRWREAGGPVRAEAGGELEAFLAGVLGSSPFLADALVVEVEFVRGLLASGPEAAFARVLADLDALPPDLPDERLMAALRRAKRRGAVTVALADLAGLWDVARATGALTELAEHTLDRAVAHLLATQQARGALMFPDAARLPRDSGFIVLGMGKLGARELNYSSDIDLVLLFDPERLASPDPDRLQQTMLRVGRGLVRLMQERTADGYVFRTDLRLRPDPASTPLALSVDAAEVYYESMGQNWERAAMLKARPVAGDIAAGAAFLHRLRPFIWRRSLDFLAIRDIHSIKRQINAHRGGGRIAVAGHNLKLGRGGIREIEFFAQTQQLIWGGRDPRLRERATIPALAALAEAGRITAAVRDELAAAYVELRRLEHRLQMVADQQTHTLPDEPGLAAFARFCGEPDAACFTRETRQLLETVERHYAQLFEDEPSLAGPGNLVFTGEEDDPATLASLAELGFRDPRSVAAVVRGWHRGRVRAMRSVRARELLTELMPTLLAALGRTADPDQAFSAFDAFLAGLPAGVQLFALLEANPWLLDFLAEVLGGAPFLADYLKSHPVVLDAVLSGGFDEPPPDAAAMAADLEAELRRADDFQDVLDAARRWANDRRFHVGVQMLRGRLDPADAGTALSDIADALLPAMLRRVAAEFEAAHGRVPEGALALVAFGKHGSRELTLTSDLDLVPIYTAPDPAGSFSDGPRPLPASTYFGRLVQRLETALATRTGEGRLFEVDLRLRPHGIDGPLATHAETFERYYSGEAWTWERMALTRARVVAGPPELARRLEAVRLAALVRPSEPDRLLADAADMRRRLAAAHRAQVPWDVKHMPGGMLDVEFVAQYLMLRHAPEHPEVLAADPVEALRRLGAAGLLDPEAARLLAGAGRLWRRLQAVLRLTGEEPFEEKAASPGLRRLLVKVLGAADFDDLRAHIAAEAAKVRGWFDRIVAEPAARMPRPAAKEGA